MLDIPCIVLRQTGPYRPTLRVKGATVVILVVLANEKVLGCAAAVTFVAQTNEESPSPSLSSVLCP